MICQYRKDRLLKHLKEVAEQVGGKLRTEPRYPDYSRCPIEQFSPDYDRDGGEFRDAGWSPFYGKGTSYEKTYLFSDSIWWHSLSDATQKSVIEWLTKTLGER